jgi:hypothetical protein
VCVCVCVCTCVCVGLRADRRIRVFNNSVMRKVFGPKRDEVKGLCERRHNEEIYDL